MRRSLAPGQPSPRSLAVVLWAMTAAGRERRQRRARSGRLPSRRLCAGGPGAGAGRRAWQSRALGLLGFMYEHGFGVPQAYEASADLYYRGAVQGDPFAQAQLGLMYDKGHGVPTQFRAGVQMAQSGGGPHRRTAARRLSPLPRCGRIKTLAKRDRRRPALCIGMGPRPAGTGCASHDQIAADRKRAAPPRRGTVRPLSPNQPFLRIDHLPGEPLTSPSPMT